MKKAFTLIELLVVVAILLILMGLVVRIGSVSKDTGARTKTVSQMQRLENALSGYYAAFGTYPPVKLHASRDVFMAVNSHGQQRKDGQQNKSLWGWLDSHGEVRNTRAEAAAWEQVRAACVAQPVAVAYPYDENYKQYVEDLSEMMKEYAPNIEDLSDGRKSLFAAGFDIGVDANGSDSRFRNYRQYEEWAQLKLFKFGVMSYLLPRYLFMITCPEPFLEYAQWTGNNNVPSDPFNGGKYGGDGASDSSSWQQMRDNLLSDDKMDKSAEVRISAIPSQSVCARWMPNFESTLDATDPELEFFGVKVTATVEDSSVYDALGGNSPSRGLFDSIEVYVPGDEDGGSTSGQYILNAITIKDGWGQEFYYYSPAPYQGYVLWSAGANGRTFPPWIDKSDSGIGNDGLRCIEYWVSDDIVGLSR